MKIFQWLLGRKSGERGILYRAVALLMIISLAVPSLGESIGVRVEELGAAPQDVITNYPFSLGLPPMTPEEISWEKHFHTGNDSAYKPDVSGSDSYIIIEKNVISFYGYATGQNMDYIFSQGVYKETFGNSFILYPTNMNFHSFSETDGLII